MQELFLACVHRNRRLVLLKQVVQLTLYDLAERGAGVLAGQAGGDEETPPG
ncbi:hypothetical protein ACFWP7_42140 [Streptomyces sp. NPDC058470]|uniref:hypothetical protein n=1 Tax=Streptomyces sp. NPDC058470 TaxID=3346515 RepID=UPI00364A9750